MDAKITFVEDVKQWWRMWSIQLGILGTALTAAFVAFPDAAVYAWNMIPADLKSFIPPQYTPLIGVAIFVVSLFARLIKQKKLAALKEQNDTTETPTTN